MTDKEGKMNPYVGHDTQYYVVEEHRLVVGKGDRKTNLNTQIYN